MPIGVEYIRKEMNDATTMEARVNWKSTDSDNSLSVNEEY